MHIKKFTGTTPAKALQAVKEDLGNEAIILSNRTIEENGVRLTEITAALDAYPATKEKKMQMTASNNDNNANNNRQMEKKTLRKTSNSWDTEWQEIKTVLFDLLKPQMAKSKLTPRQQLVFDYLQKEEVNESVLLHTYSKLLNHPDSPIISTISDLLPVRPFNFFTKERKFHFFAGAHGVGKTSIILRLALLYKKENPNRTICIVNTDVHLSRGKNQLKHYASLSNIAYKELDKKEDGENIHNLCREFDVVFVDLFALHYSLEENINSLGLSEIEAAIHLIFTPYCTNAYYEKILAIAEHENLSSIIWSKLDVIQQYGTLLNVAARSGLPVSAFSFGDTMRNTVNYANQENTWKLILKHEFPLYTNE